MVVCGGVAAWTLGVVAVTRLPYIKAAMVTAHKGGAHRNDVVWTRCPTQIDHKKGYHRNRFIIILDCDQHNYLQLNTKSIDMTKTLIIVRIGSIHQKLNYVLYDIISNSISQRKYKRNPLACAISVTVARNFSSNKMNKNTDDFCKVRSPSECQDSIQINHCKWYRQRQDCTAFYVSFSERTKSIE